MAQRGIHDDIGILVFTDRPRSPGWVSLAAIFLSVSGASPARADRCDDLAAQLKSQIDGLTVGKTAANVIYLSHPQAKEMSLGCAGRNYTNQLYREAGQPQADAGLSRSGGRAPPPSSSRCRRTTC